MKNRFPEYYRPNSEELSKLFDECLFVFDTNALLDVFRLGKDIASRVIDLIKDFHDQIVIPFYVAEEFHKDYLEVICGELAIGKEAEKLLANIDVQQLLGQDFLAKIPRCIKKDFIIKIKSIFDKYVKILNKRNEYLDSQKESGLLLRNVADLLGNVMLDGFSNEELKQIHEQGAKRYDDMVPPGYKDKSKKENKYGDLVIWNEIMREAKKRKKSVIFISNDLKEDWIQIHHGMKCGPRIELLREFRTEVPGKTFYTYTLDKFISYANEKKKSLRHEEMEIIKVILKEVPESVTDIKQSDESQKVKNSGELEYDDGHIKMKGNSDEKMSKAEENNNVAEDGVLIKKQSSNTKE